MSRGAGTASPDARRGGTVGPGCGMIDELEALILVEKAKRAAAARWAGHAPARRARQHAFWLDALPLHSARAAPGHPRPAKHPCDDPLPGAPIRRSNRLGALRKAVHGILPPRRRVDLLEGG